jgi:hypothetical protein
MTKKPAGVGPAKKRGRPVGSPPVTANDPRAADVARDFKTLLARINYRGWYALRLLALETGVSTEDRIIAGLNTTLRQHGKDPVVEKRQRPGGEVGE